MKLPSSRMTSIGLDVHVLGLSATSPRGSHCGGFRDERDVDRIPLGFCVAARRDDGFVQSHDTPRRRGRMEAIRHLRECAFLTRAAVNGGTAKAGAELVSSCGRAPHRPPARASPHRTHTRNFRRAKRAAPHELLKFSKRRRDAASDGAGGRGGAICSRERRDGEAQRPGVRRQTCRRACNKCLVQRDSHP